MANLRRLSEHCQFGTSLNDMLRDRLVCGINNDRYQRRLLAESKLTFEKALELSQSMESADKNVQELRSSDSEQQAEADVKQVLPSFRRFQNDANVRAPCYRCGEDGHHPAACRFKNTECSYCKKIGHIFRACRSRGKQRRGRGRRRGGTARQAYQVVQSEEDPGDSPHCEEEEDAYVLFRVNDDRIAPVMARLTVDGAQLEMEVDTGAGISLVSEATYTNLWPKNPPVLQQTHVRLRTYTGEPVVILGVVQVMVKYKDQQEKLKLHVVKGAGPSLLGRDWLSKLDIDLGSLNNLSTEPSTEAVLARHKSVFEEELGLIQSTTAKIRVDPQAQPIFCKPHSLPYSQKEKVEKELQHLVETGVIEPIEFSDWAAPIVPIVKQDGNIRICGDFRRTVNRAAVLDPYPLPRIEDIFAKLSGGKLFSKLDLAHAFLQIPLDDDSKKYVVINTHKGLYRYNRLPFGIHSAPAIFQRNIDTVLQGIPNVSAYIDDILLTGSTMKEHLETLEVVLARLEAANLPVYATGSGLSGPCYFREWFTAIIWKNCWYCWSSRTY